MTGHAAGHPRGGGGRGRGGGAGAGAAPPLLLLLLGLLAAAAPFRGAAAASGQLAPLLVFENGTRVEGPEAWAERRRELRGLLGEHILGHPPSSVPELSGVKELNATASRSGAVSRFVELSFSDPASAGLQTHSFVVETIEPPRRGSAGLLPVLLTQWNDRDWALAAVARGYVACIYPGSDTRDATEGFAEMYPEASWMLIMRRAWLASRVLDFLLSEYGPGVDPERTSITGHSRNGKQSLIAAAFDERFAAVVGSSPGAPIASPALFSSAQYYGETVKFVKAKRGWWVPSLADYYGREDELPIDGHAVTALVAPRALCVYSAHNDREGDIGFANERNHVAARDVYLLLGAPEALRMKYRPGDHHGYISVDEIVDFFEYAFSGFRAFAPSFPDERRFTFDWAAWNASDAFMRPPTPPADAPALERIRWTLQVDALTDGFSAGNGFGEEAPPNWIYKSELLMRDTFNHTGATVARLPVAIGNQVTANIFYPADASPSDKPLPALVWLHPASYNTGPAPVYNGVDVFHAAAAAGHVVLAFDQVGCAGRSGEFQPFYARQRTSLLARMAQDALAGAEALHCLAPDARERGVCSHGNVYDSTYPDRLGVLPPVDPSRVYVAGYGLGATVALHAAALDQYALFAGVAAFSGWTPLRSDVPGPRSLGLRRLSEVHALVPRLGLFVDNESAVPYDYCDDVLPLVAGEAGRPTLLVTPLRDREAHVAEVQECIARARLAWAAAGAPGNFRALSPDAPSHMTEDERETLLAWLGDLGEQTAAATSAVGGGGGSARGRRPSAGTEAADAGFGLRSWR